MKAVVQEELEKINQHNFIEKVHMLKSLEEKLGNEAVEIAMESIYEDTINEWKEIAEFNENNDIEELIHIIWEHVRKSGGYEFEVLTKEDGIQVNCTKCPLADMAIAVGEPIWGKMLYCNLDNCIVEGFNKNIDLVRENTIMEGHEYCDFYYKMK